MPGYISLGRYTQQGVATAKDIPSRIQQTRSMADSMGIRVIGIWMTMGKYDTVGIWESPDDQTMAAFLLSLAKVGNVTTQTMRALSEEEIAQVATRLT